MRGKKLSLLAFCLPLAAFAPAQDDLAGRQKYPQFRVLSGLPGGGFGVLPSGRPSIMGAAALTTPIGYTLGRDRYAFGIFNTGATLNPFKYDNEGSTTNSGNGTAYGMVGFTVEGFNVTYAAMVLSSEGDSEGNLQFSPRPFGRLGLSFGVQDIFTTAGASGEQLDRQEHLLSRSFYGVGTYDLGHGAYVSLGKGERRFEGVFGNASAAITSRLRAMVEYDGFNFNGGLLYGTGRASPFYGVNLEGTIFLGIVSGKYGTVGLSFTH